ncbi:hypothetical protein LL962_16985 [Xanthomonas sp. NCPPB 1067]|uniref:hypothetical protein n=1 Tax=Xanthomonas sp. NCPPB 1067 TaxID=487524 RepID=UPI001E32EBD7|nr:hypothetical protein [Xanthomonas sp. NCPPB 1067]MCC4588776.1 hypothetical protein [Xanthomonas sp. NCPPB 1067]
MTDFRTRKADRIAARLANPHARYRFQVVCTSYYLPDGISNVVGVFNSRKEAEEFAFEQQGPIAGNTKAWKAMESRCGRRLPGGLPFSASFQVERVEA